MKILNMKDKFTNIPRGFPRIWRKLGGIGWVKVIYTWFDSDEWKNDKAMPGVVVRFSDIRHTPTGQRLKWSKTYFYPCKSIPQFIKEMRKDNRFLPKELRRRDKKYAFKYQRYDNKRIL